MEPRWLSGRPLDWRGQEVVCNLYSKLFGMGLRYDLTVIFWLLGVSGRRGEGGTMGMDGARVRGSGHECSTW
jgi:hypothetical protein